MVAGVETGSLAFVSKKMQWGGVGKSASLSFSTLPLLLNRVKEAIITRVLEGSLDSKSLFQSARQLAERISSVLITQKFHNAIYRPTKAWELLTLCKVSF